MFSRIASTAGSCKTTLRLAQISSTFGATPTNHFYRGLSTMSSDITLYSFATPNGVKASITLEELGLPYKTEAIDISSNVQKEEYGLSSSYGIVKHG